jgi:uncharacterized protein DUF2846
MGAASMIKSMFAVLLLTIVSFGSLSFAQNMFVTGTPTASATGCGDPDMKFKVKSDRAQHTAQPEAGKALVYFLQDDSDFVNEPKPTTRAGLDGNWVGATHTNSYFFFSVNPGVHQLCASWQSAGLLGHKKTWTQFTASAGEVYYFVAKNVWWRQNHTGGLSLNSVDRDQGQALANSFLFSIYQVKQ